MAGPRLAQEPATTDPAANNRQLGNRESIRSGMALYRLRWGGCQWICRRWRELTAAALVTLARAPPEVRGPLRCSCHKRIPACAVSNPVTTDGGAIEITGAAAVGRGAPAPARALPRGRY